MPRPRPPECCECGNSPVVWHASAWQCHSCKLLAIQLASIRSEGRDNFVGKKFKDTDDFISPKEVNEAFKRIEPWLVSMGYRPNKKKRGEVFSA